MSLKTLKPRLGTLTTTRAPMLEAKAGATQRMRGSAWMKVRRAVMREGEFTCVDCGHISLRNQVDHDTPLEQGGSHEMANLKVRCVPCHEAKTTSEAKARAGR